MFLPPKTAVEGESKILGREAIGDGMSRDSEGSRGDNASFCEENDLCFRRVEGEAAHRAPRDKAVEGVLNPSEKNIRVRTVVCRPRRGWDRH